MKVEPVGSQAPWKWAVRESRVKDDSIQVLGLNGLKVGVAYHVRRESCRWSSFHEGEI